MTAPGDRCDVVVLGASGLTGRLVCGHLADRAGETGLTWAAAGRDAGRVRAALGPLAPPEVLTADVTDPASLTALARRARVLLNLTGPYSQRGEPVVAACVAAGTSYADLSGETPAVRRVVDRWHQPARDAGVAVVQVAGFEALPFDLAVAVAAGRAAERGAALADVEVLFTATPPPGGARALTDSVSGGTLASLVAILREPGPLRLTDPALLLPAGADVAALRRRSRLVLRPRTSRGRVVAPLVPAAFINPPVVHRSAALRAEAAGEPHLPFRYREGTDLGPARGVGGVLRRVAAGALGLGQLVLVGLTRSPAPVRRGVAALAERVLPAPGTGPTGPRTEQWRWSLALAATTTAGPPVRVHVDGRAHPGYAATARMLGELGLALAAPRAAPGATAGRSGCLTPAAVLDPADLGRFAAAGVVFSVEGD